MSATRIFIPVIALLIGGWLVFDGSRALTVGDYLTAKTGPRAGQLGPWSLLLAKAGINPRSTSVKIFHVVLGILWLIGLGAFLLRPAFGWWTLAIGSACTLWYLPLGTFLSLVELVLLFTPAIRSLK
ncbi:MAG: hypothetical protein QM760_22510 [Nibricoccus sp.]